MITDQLNNFRKQLTGLEKIPGFSGLTFKTLPGVAPAYLEKAEKTIPGNKGLNEFLCRFYQLYNGMDFSWKISSAEHEYGGSMHIPSLEKFLGGFANKEPLYKENCFSDFFQGDLSAGLHLFDQDHFENYCIGINLTSGNQMYCSFDGEIIKVETTPENYFEAGLQALGLSFWQFCHVNSNEENVTSRVISFQERYNPLKPYLV